MAVMHTTTIRASITAYSTAVGPSSALRNWTTLCANVFIVGSSSRLLVNGVIFKRRRRALRAGLADLGGDVGEGAVGVAAQGGDGRDAHHHDQGQHHRVLDGGRA